MSSVLKISEATVLAIHAAIFITNNPDRRVSTREIALFHNVSENHLSKVMLRLVRAGIVSSVRGPGGGFEIAKQPENVTLLDLYELMEGPLGLSDCLLDVPVCGPGQCVFGSLLSDVNSLVKNYLTNTTLGDVSCRAQVMNDDKKSSAAM